MKNISNYIQGKAKAMKGSIIEGLFPRQNKDNIYDNPEHSVIDPDAPKWDIPKLLWLYWGNGLYRATLASQIAVELAKVRLK